MINFGFKRSHQSFYGCGVCHMWDPYPPRPTHIMRCMYHDDEIVMVKDLIYDMLNRFMHFI